jgi:hypothetical protein
LTAVVAVADAVAAEVAPEAVAAVAGNGDQGVHCRNCFASIMRCALCGKRVET